MPSANDARGLTVSLFWAFLERFAFVWSLFVSFMKHPLSFRRVARADMEDVVAASEKLQPSNERH